MPCTRIPQAAKFGSSSAILTMRFATLLLSFALGSIANAQAGEDEIRAEVGRYVAAINRGDARAVAALYVNDPGSSSVGDGDIHRGWDRIAQLLGEAYERAGSIRMTTDSVTVFRLGSNAAIAVLRYQWLFGRASSQPVTGAMTLVYTRTRQGWRVAHDHTSTLQAPSAPHGIMTAIPDSGPTSPRRETVSCRVTRITDGDGIVCEGIGRVRLIGMDTPELNQEPYGGQATAALGALVRVGTQVQLEPDVQARDRYGRILAYVWIGNVMVNWRMVRDGWAILLTIQPNAQYVEWFIDAERRAREGGRGLWATGGFDCRPDDHRRNRCQ